MEDVNKRRQISFSLSKLEWAPQEINSREIRLYTCHFQQIGINATEIEKTGIHLKADVFAAAAVVDAKKTAAKRPVSARRPSDMKRLS